MFSFSKHMRRNLFSVCKLSALSKFYNPFYSSFFLFYFKCVFTNGLSIQLLFQVFNGFVYFCFDLLQMSLYSGLWQNNIHVSFPMEDIREVLESTPCTFKESFVQQLLHHLYHLGPMRWMPLLFSCFRHLPVQFRSV